MTILWCGGEDIDFMSGSAAPSVSMNYGHFETWNARCGLMNGSQSFCLSPPFAEQTSIRAGWIMKVANNLSTYLRLFGLTDSRGYGVWVTKGDSYNSSVGISLYNGAWTLLGTTGGAENGTYRFDLDILNYGSSATINLYINGMLVFTHSGDITIDGLTGFSRAAIGYGWNETYSALSGVIIADEDTRALQLATFAINGAGDANEFDYGAYGDINEVALSDATQIYTATVNKNFQAEVNGMPSGDWVVKAFKVAARCVDGLGNVGICLGVKSGGTVDVGSAENCTGFWQTKERLMVVNPNTGNPFTPSELDAPIQLAVKSGAV